MPLLPSATVGLSGCMICMKRMRTRPGRDDEVSAFLLFASVRAHAAFVDIAVHIATSTRVLHRRFRSACLRVYVYQIERGEKKKEKRIFSPPPPSLLVSPDYTRTMTARSPECNNVRDKPRPARQRRSFPRRPCRTYNFPRTFTTCLSSTHTHTHLRTA